MTMAHQAGGQTIRQPHPDRTLWRTRVTEWYPRWRERTFFVPPVLMNRTDHSTVRLAGRDVRVPQPPVTKQTPDAKSTIFTSDVLDDVTHQRVLHCLRGLADSKQEVMFVLSNLHIEDYLNKQRYAAAASTLPTPIHTQHRRGDFDVLIIHRHFGILTCEIKAVGTWTVAMTPEQELVAIASKVQRAVKQLHKSDAVLRVLVSDVPGPPRVRLSLMLPNVTEVTLRHVLARSPRLAQELCQCLGVKADEDPVSLCVTSDQLSGVISPHVVTDDVIEQLGQWWKKIMSWDGTVAGSSDDTYLELLARFCGPATTFRVFCVATPRLCLDMVKTEGEGASETGNRFTQVMLTQQQVAIHHRSEPLVFLCGPPGVGKSLMLVLKGLGWLADDLHVDVVSTWQRSLAATQGIVHQLQQTAGPAAAQRVHQHHLDVSSGKDGVEVAVETLVKAANREGRQGLYVIADEACEHSGLRDMVRKLRHAVPSLHLWAASVEKKQTPPCMTDFTLTQPLRCPPSVTRHVQLSNAMTEGRVPAYTTPTWPAHTDGPPTLCVNHCGRGHASGWMPHECHECGVEVARLLTQDLHVGKSVSERSKPSGQPALEYRDVFVLSFSPMSHTDGFVAGLEKARLPLVVLKPGDVTAAAEVATRKRDAVVVAGYEDVHGLERKVVVWVQGHKLSRAETFQGPDEALGRLYAMSRCTAQLVCVVPSQSGQCGCSVQ